MVVGSAILKRKLGEMVMSDMSEVTDPDAAIPDKDPRPVGYKSPPKGKPFEPGKSGNPRGRPRKDAKDNKPPSYDSELSKAFDATVEIKEKGKTRSISLLEVAAKQLAKACASGDLPAMKLAFTVLERAKSAEPDIEAPLTEAEEVIAARLIARIRFGYKYDPDN